MSKTLQKLALFALLAGLSLAVSGCLEKPESVVNTNADTNQNINQNQNVNQNTNTNVNTGEIDTSDLPSEDLLQEGWKTYRNEEYGFEFKYPGEWKTEQIDNKRVGLYPSTKGRGYEYVGDIILDVFPIINEVSKINFINSLASVYQPTIQIINGLKVYISREVPAMIPFDSYIVDLDNLLLEFIVFNNQNIITETIITTIDKI